MKVYLELKSHSPAVQAPSPSAKEPSDESAAGVPVGNPTKAVTQFKNKLGVISAFKVSCAEDKVRQMGAIAIAEAHVEATVDVITTAIRSQQTELKGVLVACGYRAGAIATISRFANGVQERPIEVGAGAVGSAGYASITHKIGQLRRKEPHPEEASSRSLLHCLTIDTLTSRRAPHPRKESGGHGSNSATDHLQNTIVGGSHGRFRKRGRSHSCSGHARMKARRPPF
jgi:hypothetical protein